MESMNQLLDLVQARVKCIISLQHSSSSLSRVKQQELQRTRLIQLTILKLRRNNLKSDVQQLILEKVTPIMELLGGLSFSYQPGQDSLQKIITIFISFFDLMDQRFRLRSKVASILRPTNGFIVHDLLKYFASFTRDLFLIKFIQYSPPKSISLKSTPPLPALPAKVQRREIALRLQTKPASAEQRLELANQMFTQVLERNGRTREIIRKFRNKVNGTPNAFYIRYNQQDLYSKQQRRARSQHSKGPRDFMMSQALNQKQKSFVLDLRYRGNVAVLKYNKDFLRLSSSKDSQRKVEKGDRGKSLQRLPKHY